MADPGVPSMSATPPLRSDIPHIPHRRRRAADLEAAPLSHPSLDAMRRNEAVIEFATLGGGNHFIEVQADADNRLC